MSFQFWPCIDWGINLTVASNDRDWIVFQRFKLYVYCYGHLKPWSLKTSLRWMIDMPGAWTVRRGGTHLTRVALKKALNQSWEVLLIISVSLMATDETDCLYKTLYQICVCKCRSLFAIRKPTCLYQSFKGIDSIRKHLQTANLWLKWLNPDANVEGIIAVSCMVDAHHQILSGKFFFNSSNWVRETFKHWYIL